MWSLSEILLPRFLTESTGKGQRKFLGGGGGWGGGGGGGGGGGIQIASSF